MNKVKLNIDGKEVEAEEGKTILEAARASGINIPTLCYNEKLAPYGACRFCTVEISKNGKSKLVVSCVYLVEDGLVVKTSTPKVIKTRKMLLELMLGSAPVLKELAKEYGVEKPRFKSEDTQCILCGQCVRYCAEVKGANALTFVGRGVNRRVAFVDEVVGKGVCMDCRQCYGLCPTGKIPRETDGAYFGGNLVTDVLAKTRRK
ncbi:MAG TPA: 2Fe-2S iron-sulfur cluster-binding protein [Dehalococcoidia bacterium]|nr:2Fe-2S iron-sulfur cluster-binding protein [Dehalococcoidia bacterium]